MTRRTYKFEQYFAVVRLGAATPAPDGKRVYFISDMSGQLNLYRMPAEGGWPRQLTTFTDQAVRDVKLSKDESRIAFMADQNGNEHHQIFVMDAEGGWPEQVTDRPDVQYQLGGFSPDGRHVVYSGNATAPQFTDVYLQDLTTRDERQLTPGGQMMEFASFSPDGTQLLVQQVNSNTDYNIWLFDVATGAGRNLTEHEGQIVYAAGPWRKDGKGFYFSSNEGREFVAVGYYDLETWRRSFLISPDWDVEHLVLNDEKQLLAYVINESGNSVLKVLNLATNQEVPLPAMPKGIIADVAFAGKDERRRLFLTMNCYNHMSAVYVLDLDRQELTLLTPTMLGNIPADAFVAPELVHIETFDGLKVPAWLYKPTGIEPGQQVPAVLSIHGGPEAQERTNYSYGGLYQYLLNQGVAILAPNIRGSSGFGASYQKRIHRDWGGAELKDMEACAKYLQSLPWVDSKRLAVWGGSFGGFATLSAASRLPDYWAAACDFCGPSNLITFANSVPPHWKAFMKGWVGDPEEDRDLLIERSPITYVKQIRCPLMVVQGAQDPRVVKAESDQMVERLQGMGREVEYLVFEDEGHGFTRRVNQLKGYKAMADFLIRHLV
jgi:dipeptidyl aminopeptidase/acylaminoacyl peptidase